MGTLDDQPKGDERTGAMRRPLWSNQQKLVWKTETNIHKMGLDDPQGSRSKQAGKLSCRGKEAFDFVCLEYCEGFYYMK